jgi:hypothetical protein
MQEPAALKQNTFSRAVNPPSLDKQGIYEQISKIR